MPRDQKHREAQRRWTVKESETRRLKQKAKRDEARDWVISLKAGRPCVDCKGHFHFSAMHWDHLPGAIKVAGVRDLVNRNSNRQAILAEIAKCELVCANCHAVRTYERAHA